MRRPYLGKLLLNWCDNCNLPIVEDSECGLCGSKTRKVPITPPGDIRPAFKDSLTFLREIVENIFGKGSGLVFIPDNKVVLLNHISYFDKMDEIIVDGYIICKVGYHPIKRKWEVKISLEGGRRLAQKKLGKYVIIDDGAVGPVSKTANVLAVGVLEASKEIEIGDEVIVTDKNHEVICVGVARLSGNKMVRGKGLAVRPRMSSKPEKPMINLKEQNWENTIKANKVPLDRYEQKAIRFIQQTSLNFDGKVAVAFSGGKDSLVTLLLVRKALQESDWEVFFADTGIEFPETIEYIEQIIKEYKLQDKFHIKTAENRFWDDFKVFGPPARDYRWCCKTCKLTPITQLIHEKFGDNVLTFVGQRRYESDKRAAEPAISRNPWVPGQVRATPIKQWVALLIWLYIMREKAPINPLYDKGFERIGCWLCPANKMSELNKLKTTHPELNEKWVKEFSKYQKEKGMPEIWMDLGLWRWKNLPGSIKQLLEREEILYEHKTPTEITHDSTIDYQLAEGISPCVNGGYSVEGHFSNTLFLEEISFILSILGKFKLSKELGAISLKLKYPKGVIINLFASGAFTIRGVDNRDEAIKIADRLREIIKKTIRCTGCSTCVNQCPNGAITIMNGKAVIDVSKCDSCEICNERCPALME